MNGYLARSNEHCVCELVKIGNSLSSILLFVLLLFLLPENGWADELKASLRTGIEYDDNVNRESTAPSAGFLARYFGTLRVSQPFSRSRITFNAKHGGKFFIENQNAKADTLVTLLSLGLQHQLIAELGMDATIDMKDRTERVPLRDYNRGGVGLGATLTLGKMRLRAGGAYRYFAFKPNPTAGSSNIEAKLNAVWTPSERLTLSGGYNFTQRFFENDRFIQDGNEIKVDEGSVRRDDFHSIFVQGRYAASFIATVSYALSLNTSNSFGQKLLRHGINASATVPLPWDFFATLKLELQRTTYEDPVLIDASFIVDEDNRNAIVASFARSFGEQWEAELRYSLFLQEFGVGEDYNRQTVFLAFAFLY